MEQDPGGEAPRRYLIRRKGGHPVLSFSRGRTCEIMSFGSGFFDNKFEGKRRLVGVIRHHGEIARAQGNGECFFGVLFVP